MSLVGGLSFGLLACRWRHRNASAELDRQRLEGEAERLRLRLTAVRDTGSRPGTGQPESRPSGARTVPAVSTRSSATVTTRQMASDGVKDGPDDLKRIKGIGPAIERALQGIGIVSFEQIANFTAADVERVSAALDGFPRRIERDDWVGSARRLLEDGAEEGGEG